MFVTCEALYMHVYCLSSFFRMGRGFIVEDFVEGYLSRLCEQSTGPITGLLIGQVQYKCTFYCHFYSAVTIVWISKHMYQLTIKANIELDQHHHNKRKKIFINVYMLLLQSMFFFDR